MRTQLAAAAEDAGIDADRTVTMVAAGELFAGAERQILALLTYLRVDGYRTILAVFNDSELARRARELGVEVVVLPGRGAFRKQAVRRIAELVRDTGTRVVHFHGYKSALHVALARRLVRFASVATIHGAPEYSGPLIGRLRAWMYSRCELWSIRVIRARTVFVTGELVKKVPGLARTGTYQVIPNGVDPETMAQLARPVELDPAHFNIVVVGRLETVKGITFAIEAMRSPTIPPKVRLWIVGDGPERARLETQVRDAGLEQNVLFTGFRKDAVAFTAHANLLLMPSLHEGLPYAMLEALAAATPIAASKVGGLAEALTDRDTAFLFPAGNAAAIAAIIAAVAADPEAGKRTGQHAHRELFPRFNAAVMARGYEQIYASLNSATIPPPYL
jgi:glycosyltransferase involved in cell wall biosynthesis